MIKVYALHVRLNASVRSGIQLLLVEQGDSPEMFRIEFLTKKIAKGLEQVINSY